MVRAQAGLIGAPVYDPVLRLLHWVNAFLVLILLASGLISMYMQPGPIKAWLHFCHGYAGVVLIIGVIARLVWGLAGPSHARLRDMWKPAEWRNMLVRRQPAFSIPQHFGHHPSASLAYLGLYGLLVLASATGLVLLAIAQGVGPLEGMLAWDAANRVMPQDLHELAAWAVLGFLVLHMAALVLHPLLHGLPIAQAMWTGVQYVAQKETR